MQAQELGKHLPGNLTDLTTLDLSRNHLHIEGVTAVTQGCSQLPSLSFLHLGVAVGGEAELQAAKRVVGDHVHVEMQFSVAEWSDEHVMYTLGDS